MNISLVRVRISFNYDGGGGGGVKLFNNELALVVQWTEYLTSDQRVGGSNPPERAIFK